MFADWNAILQAMHNSQFTDSFNRSANSPIPGLTGPRGLPGFQVPTPGVPQNLPDPRVLSQAPTMGNHMMQPFQSTSKMGQRPWGLIGGHGGWHSPGGQGKQLQ